jgi:hypothetical protein
MLELAWHDVRIDLDSVTDARREEALAAKITAYEWITSDSEHVLSFRFVCAHLGIEDIDRARRVILRDVVVPSEPIPARWLEEFASTERDDRAYVKRRKAEPYHEPCDALDAESQAYSLESLVAEISGLNIPAGDENALAAWESAAESEGSEEDG